MRHRESPRAARRRALTVVALAIAVLVLLVPLELTREATADRLVHWVDQLTRSSTAAMTVAGWLTYALVPLAAVVFDRDHERRYGRRTTSPASGRPHGVAEPDLTGTVHLTEAPRPDVDRTGTARSAANPRTDTGHLVLRQRAERGHRLARRTPGHWLRRAPLLVVIALAVLFLPVRGIGTDLVDRWRAAYSGAAFVTGWHWSMPAAALGVIVVVLGPLFATLPPPGTRPSRRTHLYLLAAALPLVALPLALWA